MEKYLDVLQEISYTLIKSGFLRRLERLSMTKKNTSVETNQNSRKRSVSNAESPLYVEEDAGREHLRLRILLIALWGIQIEI